MTQSAFGFTTVLGLLGSYIFGSKFTALGPNLNVTVSAAENSVSVIQCWQMSTPFKKSTQNGTAGVAVYSLGDLGAGSYSVIPGGTNGGAHPAPSPQWVLLMSGIGRVSVPGTSDLGYIFGGTNGLLFAADTVDLAPNGHVTEFLTDSVLVQIPTADGKVPDHTVLHNGACTAEDLL